MCLLAISHVEIFTTHRDSHLIFAATCYVLFTETVVDFEEMYVKF